MIPMYALDHDCGERKLRSRGRVSRRGFSLWYLVMSLFKLVILLANEQIHLSSIPLLHDTKTSRNYLTILQTKTLQLICYFMQNKRCNANLPARLGFKRIAKKVDNLIDKFITYTKCP